VLAPVVRDEVRRLDPNVPVNRLMTLEDAARNARWNPRVAEGIITTITLIALVLATVGLAALTAHAVAQRSRELGIRLALGATQLSVVMLVLRRVLLQALVGVAVGSIGAKAWDPQVAAGNLAAAAVVVIAVVVVCRRGPPPAPRGSTRCGCCGSSDQRRGTAQSTHFKPTTRPNSLTLDVTSVSAASRLTGEQHVVGADRLAGRFELGATVPASRASSSSTPSTPRTREERLEPLGVGLFALAFRDAIPKLERHDRGETA
jgi:hypothetical protein